MSAKSVCDMSCGAMHEFALVLDKAGFDGDLIQKIVNSRGNRMAKTMYVAVTNGTQVDERFEYIKTIEVLVPEGYAHDTRLDSFRAAHQSETNKEFYYYNPALTDANYAQIATTKLTAGRKFAVKIFGIKQGEVVTSDDCLAQLKRVNAVLTGAQGASLVYEQRKNELPKGKYYVSFNEKNALWEDSDGSHGVPYVDAGSAGDFGFGLGDFELVWYVGYCLLAFCDLPAGEA